MNMEKIVKLFMTFIYLNKATIDINQRLISEELFENKTFDKIFFTLKIHGQRIKVEVNHFANHDKGSNHNNSNNNDDKKSITVSSKSTKPTLIDI